MKPYDEFPKLFLKPNREKPLHKRNPWIFSGAVEKVQGDPKPGDTVGIFLHEGEFLAWGAISPHSQIRARVWSFEPDDVIDESFFRRKISRIIERRASLGFEENNTNAYRLIHAESDGIPGLIVDKYDDVLVMQSLTAGSDHFKKVFVEILSEAAGCKAVYERSDVEIRKLEGLSMAFGPLFGDPPAQPVEIIENGLRFLVDIIHGQKTGFYLDQRDNRRTLRELAFGKEILDCFCYTGGFTVSALGGGAGSLTSVDSSDKSLKLARENAALNGFDPDGVQWVRGDVSEALRDLVSRQRKFDLVVLDPPKFASSLNQVPKAQRAYKDINMLGFKLLRPGGLLFTFSCSGALGAEEFQTIIAWAAMDARVEAGIIKKMTQAADHPIALNFPKSEYLKGLVVRVG